MLNDRTQAPSGAGYALENRIVLSRILPEAFRECRVHRLALFFRGLRESLRDTAPHNRDNPRIVLLTPGPLNETYFEHAYLARYLGYALVEGSDLTVRDNRVYLKVLGGLQLVDCIVRRLDDEYCDPLELRADSRLGVPGLVQAVRTGHVSIANALGSGLVETPALLPFLPGICRMLLGEELKLPSIATWWCGQPEALKYVLENLENLVVKAVLPGRADPPQFGDATSREERAALAHLLRANPAQFVAQEILPLSTAPVLVDQHLEPRHIVLRTYLAGTGDTYAMMPGGLTRVTRAADTLVVSMQAGGGSKDTWFLSDGPVSNFSLLGSPTRPVELSRGGGDLPSRAADNLFWLGRYAERADGKARLLRGILARLTERDGGGDGAELPILFRVLRTPSISAATDGRTPLSAGMRGEAELRREIFDFDGANSLASILRSARLAAGTIRDRISTDMARLLAGLDELADPGGGLEDVLDAVRRPIATLAAFGGLAMESMTRGQGWRFLDMGRRIERSLHAMRLLQGTLAAANAGEAGVLEAALEISDSLMTYRRRYLGSLQPAPVIDLLLADGTNPRSIAFQFASLAENVAALPRDLNHPGPTPEQRLMIAGTDALQLAEIESLAAVDAAGRRPELSRLLGSLEGTLWKLSDTITRHYLIHLQPSRHLAAGPDDVPGGRPTP